MKLPNTYTKEQVISLALVKGTVEYKSSDPVAMQVYWTEWLKANRN